MIDISDLNRFGFGTVRFFLELLFLTMISMTITACVKPPPSDINHICMIFKQYPKWYQAALDVERRWRVPVSVQMAIIHQESKFEARARPERTRLFYMIPWKRPSSAYGYAQALRTTWDEYKRSQGWVWSSRNDFSDGVDFIGWYANEANKRAGIARADVYSLYLAYHEGIGGYQRKTYLKKPWLITVARKVEAKSHLYAMQLQTCKIV